jgi:hypothetical protein
MNETKRYEIFRDPNIEFKKSFELFQQISLKVSTKAGINFSSFCMDQVEWNEAKG